MDAEADKKTQLTSMKLSTEEICKNRKNMLCLVGDMELFFMKYYLC